QLRQCWPRDLTSRASLAYAGAGEVAEGEAMDEAEWLACTNPKTMLDFLQGKASDRKLRLFACACCRRFWNLFTDKRAWKAIEFAERYADGLATTKQLHDSAWEGLTKENVSSFGRRGKQPASLQNTGSGWRQNQGLLRRKKPMQSGRPHFNKRG